MELHHDGWALGGIELRLDRVPLGPQRRDRDRRFRLRDEAAHVALVGTVIGPHGGLKARFDLAPGSGAFGGEALPLGVVASHETFDALAIPQLLGQAPQHGALDHVEVERASHVARPALLHRRARDADAATFPVLHAHPAAAAAAAEQAGQEVFRLSVGLGHHDRGLGLHHLRALEQRVVDDAQVLGRCMLPLVLGVDAADPLPRVRVLHHPHPVPHDGPVVDRVHDDPVPALAIAVDGDRGPPISARRLHAFTVQLARDIARAPAGDIGSEHAPDDGSLGLDDLELARLARHGAIAVGAAAGVPTVAHDARHAAAHLVGEVLEVEGADEPPDADLHVIGHAVVNGADLDAGESEALENAGEVFLVAADAVERFDHEHLELAFLRGFEQPHDAVAVDERGSGAGAVLEGRHDREPVALGIAAAERDLVLDGSVALQVRAEPAVDRGAGHRLSGPGVGGGPRGRLHGRGGPARRQGHR